MIKNLSVICIFLILWGCKSEKAEELNRRSVYIKGIIHNDNTEFFTVFKSNVLTDNSETLLIHVSDSGRFEYNLSIDYPHEIVLQPQAHRNIPVFVSPGDSITLECSDSVLIKYSDLSAQRFNDDLKLVEGLLNEVLTPVLNPKEYQRISETELKRRVDSLKNELTKALVLISNKNDFSPDFINIARNEIDFAIISSIADYALFNEYIFKIKRDIPASYYRLPDSLLSNFNKLVLTSNTFTFFNRMQFIYSADSINRILKLKPSLIRDIFVLKAINQIIIDKEFDKAKELMDMTFPAVINQELKEHTMHRYQVAYGIYKNPRYSKAKLKLLTSNDSSGLLKEITRAYPDKVLYLKFWAPWCGPCMAQLPYAKEIEKEFDPADFLVINLCVVYPKDKWKAAIKEHNISGVHYLLTDKQYNELRALLNIQGIPRYVLINKKGEIVDKDAPIPGDDILPGINYSLVERVENLIEDK